MSSFLKLSGPHACEKWLFWRVSDISKGRPDTLTLFGEVSVLGTAT